MPRHLIGVDFPIREVSEASAGEHPPRLHLHPAHLVGTPPSGCLPRLSLRASLFLCHGGLSPRPSASGARR
jgi:hypothetical protein